MSVNEDKLIENQILKDVHQVFIRDGVRVSTMDAICKKLGISKKTLYKYVDNKSDLIMKILRLKQTEDEIFFEALLEKNQNAIDQLYDISKFIISKLEMVNPIILAEFEEYYPEALDFINEQTKTMVYANIFNNIKTGIKEGLYREDIKADIVANSYVVLTRNMFCNVLSNDMIDKHGLKAVYVEVFRYHIRGVSNHNGIEYLNEKIKKEKLKH